LSFGYNRLNQSGVTGSRKKTNNKWFELQDSISYYNELEKPKIIWGEISDEPKFTIDETGYYYPEATTFFLTGEHLQFLLCYLNSKLSEFLFSQIGTTTGVGTIRWKKYTIEQLNVPQKSQINDFIFDELSKKIKKTYSKDLEMKINEVIYELFELDANEIAFVENYSSKSK